MTPEQRAALGRMRRFAETGPNEFTDAHDGWQQREYVQCLEHAANLALAEHLPDDDEPVTLDWLEEQLHDSGFTIACVAGRFSVQFESRIHIQTRGQLRRLVEALEGR